MPLSREILSKMSADGLIILDQPGKLKDKWFRLSKEDQLILEEVMNRVDEEVKHIVTMISKVEENKNDS